MHRSSGFPGVEMVMAVIRTTLIIMALLLGWAVVRHEGGARGAPLPISMNAD